MSSGIVNITGIMSKSKQNKEHIIASNRKALHDYTIIEKFEAGLVLQGWEVKSLRANRVQLKDSYVVFKDNEAWMINTHISPLSDASTHIDPNPERSRKLLLNRRELSKLHEAISQQGLTIVPLNLHWHQRLAKVTVALVRGKKQYDKRESAKKSDWQREQGRLIRSKLR